MNDFCKKSSENHTFSYKNMISVFNTTILGTNIFHYYTITNHIDRIDNQKCFDDIIPHDVISDMLTNNCTKREYVRKVLNKCNYITLTPNMTFILVYLSIKKINPDYLNIISLLKIRYNEWKNLVSTNDKMKWIQSLFQYSNKSFIENAVDLSLYILFESYHNECLLQMIGTLDLSKINLIRGLYSTYTPYVALNNNHYDNYIFTNNDIIESITMKSGSNHSQLYVINENFKFICDSDEFNQDELNARKLGKFSDIQIMNIFPIQTITDDSYCIFHSLRLIFIICQYQFTEFNKNEVRQINKSFTFNGKIHCDKIVQCIQQMININNDKY